MSDERELRQVEHLFKIPQKDNIHFYDRIIAVDYDEAVEKIKEKYPNQYFEWAGRPKLIKKGWHPNRTGYKRSEFDIKMMEALGAGW